jgi:hypothetical protein
VYLYILPLGTLYSGERKRIREKKTRSKENNRPRSGRAEAPKFFRGETGELLRSIQHKSLRPAGPIKD